MPGSDLYEIEYIEDVIKNDIKRLPKNIKTTIKRAIETRLMLDPIGFGKPLRYSLKGHRRLRVSDYRVVYRIEEDDFKVVIIAIRHRKDVYK